MYAYFTLVDNQYARDPRTGLSLSHTLGRARRAGLEVFHQSAEVILGDVWCSGDREGLNSRSLTKEAQSENGIKQSGNTLC